MLAVVVQGVILALMAILILAGLVFRPRQ